MTGKMALKKDLKRMKDRALPTQWPDTDLFALREATIHSVIHETCTEFMLMSQACFRYT